MIMVETEQNGESQEDEINFDEITINEYCNTKKGRADVICKHEL